MTWSRFDDQTARSVSLRTAGHAAALLFFVSIIESGAVDGDGHLSELMVRDVAHLFEIPWRKAAPRLVELGLWHDAVTVKACASCIEHGGNKLADGSYLIHQWWDHLLRSDGKNDPVQRARERRRKALNRDVALVAAVRQRDRDLCRYCGVLTVDSSTQAKKNLIARQLDHVDPWGENTFDNVVVACRTCNGRKNARTPEQAGMPLLPAGTAL